MLARLPLIAYILLALALAVAVAIAADQQTETQLTQPSDSSDSRAVRAASQPNDAGRSDPAAEAPPVRRNLAAAERQPLPEANRRALVASLLAAWYIAPQSR